MPAPVGNQNAKKGRIWAKAIERALWERSQGQQAPQLDRIARKLVDMAAEGDLEAIKEIGNRLDGKPSQAIAFEDQDGKPSALVVRFVAAEANQ